VSDENKPRFDPTVNLGHLLTFGGFIVSGLVAFFSVKGELGTVGDRVGRIETQLERVAQLMVSGARQDAEIGELRRRMDRIDRTP
jgi:hypothetical protein